jgi:hypothetical protein
MNQKLDFIRDRGLDRCPYTCCFTHITGKEDIRSLPIICACGGEMKQERVSEHFQKECLYAVVFCKYRRINSKH